jgi:hypothetical protein
MSLREKDGPEPDALFPSMRYYCWTRNTAMHSGPAPLAVELRAVLSCHWQPWRRLLVAYALSINSTNVN